MIMRSDPFSTATGNIPVAELEPSSLQALLYGVHRCCCFPVVWGKKVRGPALFSPSHPPGFSVFAAPL